MEIKTDIKKGAAIVSVSGRIDAMTSADFENSINSVIAAGESLIILDFKGVDYISSAGLRVILAKAKALKGKGGKLVMSGVKGTVKDVFDISGFGSIFSMYESADAAVSGIG